MTELKESRWVKIHEPGQANYEPKENIMDILIGESRCQADVTYTVPSYKKAAYWLGKYLDAAGAAQVLHEIAGQIEAASENKADVDLNTESWNCQIEKMAQGVFKVQLVWTPNEPVTKKQKPAKNKVTQAENNADEQFTIPKKFANRVEKSWQNNEGYWIQLKDGWQNNNETTIHAESAKDAVAILKECTKN